MSNSKVLCCGFILAVFFNGDAVAQDSWIQKTNIPTARFGHGVVNVNTKESKKIYVIGGYDKDAVVISPVEEYVPATDTWTTKSAIPTLRGYASCTVVGGKIIVMGGYNPATVVTVEIYDPATNTWTSSSSMPTARWGHAAALVSGKIHIIGGARYWPAEFHTVTDIYDPQNDTWSIGAGIPTPRWGLSSCIVNGKVYAIGGTSAMGTVGTVEEYDPSTDKWTKKSSMPNPRWGLTTATLNGKIYAIGGADRYPPLSCSVFVEEYDPVTDTWTTKSPIPVARTALAPCAPSVDGKIYVIGGGGLTEYEAYPEVYVYDPGNETGIENIIINPVQFLLYQNYPNPFSRTARIAFDVHMNCHVTLKVYDVLCREVSTLVNGDISSGHHVVLFDGADLPSGLYFYKIEMENFRQTRRMLLSK